MKSRSAKVGRLFLWYVVCGVWYAVRGTWYGGRGMRITSSVLRARKLLCGGAGRGVFYRLRISNIEYQVSSIEYRISNKKPVTSNQ